ncbi:MAG TPA: anthranilate synthase component I, partial [Micromonosporaceae bacterium]
MTYGVITPDEATFRHLARSHRVVPVTRRLLADGETPVGVYRKLAGGPGSFLLESAEQGAASSGTAWSRYSFVGVRSVATLTSADGAAVWLGAPPLGLPTDGDAVDVLRATVAALASSEQPETGEDLPPLTGGLVGFLAYDIVRRFERLPNLSADDLGVPELGMVLATDLVVLDHFEGSAVLV